MLPGLKRRLAQTIIFARPCADNDDIDVRRSDDLVQLTRAACFGIVRHLFAKGGVIKVAQGAEAGALPGGEISRQIGAPIAEADNSNACRCGVTRHVHLPRRVD